MEHVCAQRRGQRIGSHAHPEFPSESYAASGTHDAEENSSDEEHAHQDLDIPRAALNAETFAHVMDPYDRPDAGEEDRTEAVGRTAMKNKRNACKSGF